MSDKLNENSVNETEVLSEKENENLEAAEAETEVTETAEAQEQELEINAESPKLEEIDNWEFEATAHTLDDTYIENDELVIEIPKKDVSLETRERPKAAEKKETPKAAPPKNDNRNATLFLTVAILGVLIVGALTFLGIRYYTVPATIGASETREVTNPGNVALDINGTKVTTGMYSYYYNQILTSYATQAQQGYYELDLSKDLAKQKVEDDDGKKITWKKKLDDETQEWLKQLVAYYSKGVEDGIVLTEDERKTIDEEIKTVKETAEDSGLSVSEYLTATYGNNVTIATLRNSSEWYLIAQNYSRKMATELRPTDKEALDYFNKHKDDFLQVKFAWLPMIFNDKNKDKVVKQAKEYSKNIKTSDDLKKIIPTACKSLIKEYVESGQFGDADAVAEQIAKSTDASVTKDNPNQYPEDIIKFLFDDKNKVGTCTTVVDDQYAAVYIVLKQSDPAPVEDKTYSVRHILVMPESDEDGEDEDEDDNSDSDKAYTKAQWSEAKKKVDDIYNEFLRSDKSEYQFALLAEKYSGDPGSISTGGSGAYGGLYYKQSLGTMVKEFEEWSTDDARKYGDTDIVKTKYGYHIMFFVDVAPDYLMDCKTAVSYDMEEKFIDSYKIKKNERILNRTIKAVNDKVKRDMTANESAQEAADSESAGYVDPDEAEAEEAADAAAAEAGAEADSQATADSENKEEKAEEKKD